MVTGVSLQTGKPSRYVTSQLGQLSLAIPLWIGTTNTSGGDCHRYARKPGVVCSSMSPDGWSVKAPAVKLIQPSGRSWSETSLIWFNLAGSKRQNGMTQRNGPG